MRKQIIKEDSTSTSCGHSLGPCNYVNPSPSPPMFTPFSNLTQRPAVKLMLLKRSNKVL